MDILTYVILGDHIYQLYQPADISIFFIPKLFHIELISQLVDILILFKMFWCVMFIPILLSFSDYKTFILCSLASEFALPPRNQNILNIFLLVYIAKLILRSACIC